MNNFKKTLFLSLSLLLTIIFFPTLSGCTKDSINGYLDGRWQILDIEKDGIISEVKNLQLYYNFYMHVCSLSEYGYYFTDGNMNYEEKNLYLDFPYADTDAKIEKLKAYGIYSNPVVFKVEHIDKKQLILKEGNITITLRKF